MINTWKREETNANKPVSISNGIVVIVVAVLSSCVDRNFNNRNRIVRRRQSRIKFSFVSVIIIQLFHIYTFVVEIVSPKRRRNNFSFPLNRTDETKF